MKNTLSSQAVLGSHRALPGGPVGALGGRPTAPTAMDGSDDVSRRGKGLTYPEMLSRKKSYAVNHPTLYCKRRIR